MLQHFLAQQKYDDGRACFEAQPDHSTSDPDDNEVSENEDSETKAWTTDLGIGLKKTGTSDCSLAEFLADWSDSSTNSSVSAPGAELWLPLKTTAKDKHPRDEPPPVADSKFRASRL